MEPRDLQSLLDILLSGRRLAARVEGKTFDDFLNDLDLQDIVLYRPTLIGESARRLIEPQVIVLEGISWSDVISLRNRVIHAYDDVDLSLIWATVTSSLPSLVRQIEPLIPPEYSVPAVLASIEPLIPPEE